MTTAREPTVFLLDDDAAVRQSVASMARSMEMPLTILGSAADFLEKFDPAQPGCLVAAVHSSNAGGLELLEQLHEAGIFFAAIAIAAKAEAATAVRAMRAGAIDFLEKPLDEERLWNSLQEALQRDAAYRQRQVRMERIRRRMESLTEGESEVLNLLRAGKLNREIAESLKISVRAVEVRRAKLMGKMKASSMAELLRDAILLDIFSEKQP